MPTIDLWVPGLPIAQPRQKHNKFGGNYVPKEHPVHVFKAMIRMELHSQWQGELWDCPIKLDVIVWFPRPKNKEWRSRPMPAYPHIVKPDADNILKCLMDALNKVLWVDDSRVCDEHVVKMVCGATDFPGVSLCISTI